MHEWSKPNFPWDIPVYTNASSSSTPFNEIEADIYMGSTTELWWWLFKVLLFFHAWSFEYSMISWKNKPSNSTLVIVPFKLNTFLIFCYAHVMYHLNGLPACLWSPDWFSCCSHDLKINRATIVHCACIWIVGELNRPRVALLSSRLYL